jgi:predicted signal transduction protein with EAL and GGDEF domain
MAHHAISSHVLDAFLISPKVAAKWKRKLLLALDGRYLDLVNDKFGSRVGDTIWDRAADGFMKVSSSASGRARVRGANFTICTATLAGKDRQIVVTACHRVEQ